MSTLCFLGQTLNTSLTPLSLRLSPCLLTRGKSSNVTVRVSSLLYQDVYVIVCGVGRTVIREVSICSWLHGRTLLGGNPVNEGRSSSCAIRE